MKSNFLKISISLLAALGTVDASNRSDSSCDVCKEVSELDSEASSFCHDVKKDIDKVFEALENTIGCDATMAISEVPVVISQPGKYCVTQDLVYNGSLAAITVTANNVSINFYNHSLTLTNENAQGIFVQNASEFTLENDIIQGSSLFQTDTSAAIYLSNVSKAHLVNLYTMNTTKGIWIQNSSDVLIERSFLEAHESSDFIPPVAPFATTSNPNNGGGVRIENSSGITVDKTVFLAPTLEDQYQTDVAFYVVGSSNITLKNSQIYNWLSSIDALSVDGFLIEGCEAIANVYSENHLVQLGDVAAGSVAHDIIIRNSIFNKALSEAPDFDGIMLVQGSGCLIEDVVVDTVCFESLTTPGALHIGNGEFAFSEVVVSRSVFSGYNTYTVMIENGLDVTIRDSQITSDDLTALMMTGAANCVVKNCFINGVDYGVRLDTTGKNAIINCQITGAATTGIVVLDSAGNNISGNSVFGNYNGIDFSASTDVEAYFNVSCNNRNMDCNAVLQDQLPGDTPVFAGSNVCCSVSKL